MHLMITERTYKGKTDRHAKIVETYREKGKTPRKKVILNLGPVKSNADLEKYHKILRGMKHENEFVNIKDITIDGARQFGITYTANALSDKYGIKQVLSAHLSNNSAKFDVYSVIKALIINRFEHGSSELAALEWIHEDYVEDLDVELHHLYRALDHLISKKEDIEDDIFDVLKKKLKLKTDLTHYDLTSSYFEGQCCPIALFGHSRDHRPDRKQIVIGLAMCDGIPITHEVYKGNTKDETTLSEMQQTLKERFGINKTVIVADRGIMTKNNVNEIENLKYDYIMGINRRNNKIAEQLLVKDIESSEKQYAKEMHKDVTKTKVTRRYILCIDQDTQKQRLEELKIIKSNIQKKLGDLRRRYKNSQERKKGKKMKRDSLMLQAYGILGKNKRIFKVEYKNGLMYSLIKKAWDYEKKIAGKFLLVTNTDIEANEAMRTYKELQRVEEAFDEIKNFLKIRGIYHRKKERVKAHVFICVLSFLLESIIEKLCDKTARVVTRMLKRIQVVKLELKGKEKKIVTRISQEQQDIFKQLKIPNPFSPN